MAERPPYRLPRTALPRRYELVIEPNLPDGRFVGTVRIEVDVHEPLNEMILNALDLTIGDVSWSDADHANLIASVTDNADEEQIVIHFDQAIQPGSGILSIHYQGELGNDLRGFYRTTVQGPDGQPVIIASTHCEATDARQIFPGWDEPEFKAVFQITAVVDESLTAISNAREVSNTVDGQGKRRIVFADTMPMSTYLVALVVGPYKATNPINVGKTPVRVAYRPGFEGMTDWAEKAAQETLGFFENYFGIPYPGDKLDHVAVPEFAAGAMENLGCVTYREEYLLMNPERAALQEKAPAVSVIAHETAHMWFGDLVTMRWWNGIWLNEAFATLMQELASDALHPEWEVWTTFSHGRAYAMTIDGLASTRSIEFPVGRPVESWAMFDVLTYQKGGSVLRMLEQYLGPEVFRRGISHYLTTHKYGNTETSDLWDALESVSGQPVRSMMDSWVFQPGFPLVHASLSEDGKTLTLTQTQFRYQGEGEGRWQVPVVVGIHGQSGESQTVRKILASEPLAIPVPQDVQWITINQGGWGFYRSAYDNRLWEKLLGAFDQMTAIERYQLVDDAWAGVESGAVPLQQAVQLWRALGAERDPDVWGAVATNVNLLWRVADEASKPVVAQFIRDIAGPIFAELGWEPKPGEDVRLGRLRAALVQLLGISGNDSDVVHEARQRFPAILRGESSVAPDLLTPIVNVVAANGDASDWDAIYRAFKESKTPQDETRYLFALARFRKPELIQRTINLYYSSEVRLQDAPIALAYLVMNSRATEAAWESIEQRWDALLEKFPKSMFAHFIQPTATVVEETLAERIQTWLRDHPVAEVARSTTQAMEFQGINRAMARRVKDTIADVLSRH
ncbi:M1 family metallopeptidase [Sulfobacillus harzensis]|uniref:Aminopeptidase n=1 Tax=Sulfobacillus harzensis TaxID=2729629 RepID=A0A7Y0Q235_9FIRM|nr:M1 family metallopeptidase [Sulfobacillus harzensis]NMP22067.1 M1 family metallopeptidase [Sulfobacillus harzensis]